MIAGNLSAYFKSEENNRKLAGLLSCPRFRREETEGQQVLAGFNFVITGSVEHFANRGEIKELIESLGRKVTASVTGKTNYLINNDKASNSWKYKNAKELGITSLSEEDFLKLAGQQQED